MVNIWSKPTELAHAFFYFIFLFCSCVFSVFVALSTVFHSIDSPDNSPFSHFVLPSLPLLYWSFQLYVSLWKSLSALILSLVVDWDQNNNELANFITDGNIKCLNSTVHRSLIQNTWPLGCSRTGRPLLIPTWSYLHYRVEWKFQDDCFSLT